MISTTRKIKRDKKDNGAGREKCCHFTQCDGEDVSDKLTIKQSPQKSKTASHMRKKGFHAQGIVSTKALGQESA